MLRILSFLCLLNLVSFGQHNDALDSLLFVSYSETVDTARVNAFLAIADEYQKINRQLAESNADSAVVLAKEISYKQGQLRALEKLGSLHLSRNSYDSAILFYSQCAKIDSSQSNKIGLARQQDNIGTVYYYQGDYSKTLKHFKNRLLLCEEVGDSSCISAASNNVGVVMINLGRYEEAIEYNLTSLKIDENRNYTVGILSSKMSLGNIHFYLEDYDKSLEYYFEVIEVSEQMGGQELRISYAYNNIASIYYKQRQFELSVEYYLRSLSIEEKHGNKNGIALKYNNLGSAYRDLGDRDQAIHYYNKSLEIREEIKDIYGLSSSKNNLAQLYLDEDDIKKSVEYYKSALLDAENSGSLEQQKVSYQGLAKSYKTAGRLDLALLNQEMYAVIKDSLLNEESAKQIAALEAQYENEKKEKEIELLSRERELNRIRMAEQEAVVKQRSTQRNFLIGAIISVLIISLLLLYNYRTQLKVKEDINKRNREFEDLRSSFFARISHEFRTPLTLISSPVEELINKYKSDQETKWTLQLVQRSSTKLLNLINQLLDLSKLEVGRLQLTVAKTDFIDWIRILAASFESLATDKQLKFSVIIPEAPIIFFHDKHKLEQIAENLLFNAFKFSSDHGEIVFKVLVEGEKIFIIVINEGTPIPQEELTKIFEPFYQAGKNRRPAEGTGIGLVLVKELSELHHGQVHVICDDNGQTTFTVEIPTADAVYAVDQKSEAKLSKVSKMIQDQSDATNEYTEHATSSDPDISVLIVEDNDDMRSYIQRQFVSEYNIMEAKEGREGLLMAQSTIPDLIISDLMMPVMDGMEMLQLLRADVKTNHIPVIMLTAKSEKKSRLSGIEKGADHYMNKPFDIIELKIRAKSLINQRLRIRAHYYAEFISTPSIENFVSVDDQFLSKVVAILDEQLDNHEFSVDDFAKALAMSRVQLHRKIKAILGCPASEFIRHYRLKKAHQYLKGKKGTVSEIAYSVGFNNLSYFTKAFKEVYKTNPSALLK